MTDEELAALAAQVGVLRRRADDAEADVSSLQAVLQLLVRLLLSRGDLGDGHRRLLERVQESKTDRPRVRLAILEDKHEVPNSDVDCASLLPLCQARCCTFTLPLSTQDLEGGRIRWEIDQPYMLRHEPDGYCAHFDRAGSGGCTAYADRPATCRRYDCRTDARVWVDFAKRIPAPLDPQLSPPRGLGAR